MNKRFITTSSALWALSTVMFVTNPVFAQRGGREGGGSNRDRGGSHQSSGSGSSRQWSGGNQHRSSGQVSGDQSRNDGNRSRSTNESRQLEVRVAPSPSIQDSQRSYRHDSDRWTQSNQYRGNDYRGNDRSGNQWNSRYPSQWTQRNYPNYDNYRNYGNYGRSAGIYGNNFGLYGNNFAGPYGYYGNNYGNGPSLGYGLSGLVGLATGLGGYGGLGGFGIPGVGLGYGGYGAYGPFGYNSGYSSSHSRPYIANNPASGQAETYVTTPTSSNEFLESGKASFLAGDYVNAQRQANHAVVEMPQNAKAHELMLLSTFAQGEFQDAAAAAHAVAELGQVPDWPTLYSYYKDRDKYVQQLNKLQQFVKEHPDMPEGRFLLGFNYQMIGEKNQAEKQFAQYLQLVRGEDPVAVKLFSSVGGDVSTLPIPEAQVPVNTATEDRTD